MLKMCCVEITPFRGINHPLNTRAATRLEQSKNKNRIKFFQKHFNVRELFKNLNFPSSPFALFPKINMSSGSAESPYQNAQTENTSSSTPHANGFLSRSPQTEPVDFSGPRMSFGLIGPTPYSRESTPDSGGSHYIDNFRDPSGEGNGNLWP